jgi:hypothetical protein
MKVALASVLNKDSIIDKINDPKNYKKYKGLIQPADKAELL